VQGRARHGSEPSDTPSWRLDQPQKHVVTPVMDRRHDIPELGPVKPLSPFGSLSEK
jgi:hypothetical protein